MKTHINLLPTHYLHQQMVWRRMRRWSVVWAIAATACLTFSWHLWSRHEVRQSRLASLQEQHENVKRLQRRIRKTNRQIAVVDDHDSKLRELSDTHSMLTLLARIAQAVDQCDGRLGLQQVSVHERQGASRQTVELKCVALDKQSLPKLDAELRRTEIFSEIKQGGTGTAKINGRLVNTYRVECSF